MIGVYEGGEFGVHAGMLFDPFGWGSPSVSVGFLAFSFDGVDAVAGNGVGADVRILLAGGEEFLGF